MAKVKTRVAFDMSAKGDLNLHDLLTGRDARFNEKLIRLEYKKTHERDTFKGSFAVDAGSKTISGSAKSWTHSKKGHLQWEIKSAGISASAVLKAAKSKTSTDDKMVVEKTFSGNDKIVGSKFVDKLYGYAGNDTIEGGGSIDKIDGGKGHDRVTYEHSLKAIDVTLTGAHKSIVFTNGIASDRIVNIEDAAGGKGDDTLTGDKKANLLIGNNGADLLVGLKGNDTLLGGKHNDTLVGGGGKDLLDGGKHADVLSGGGGNDTLLGGEGKGVDFLDGGGGKDSLNGGAGNDTLVGGAGKDTMTGGADADTFRFLAVSDSPKSSAERDVITDFTHKIDKIDLSAIDAITSVAGLDDAFIRDAKGNSHTKPAEGHIGWYTVNKSGTANDRTYIVINNDADKAIDMTIELHGVMKLGNIDFIL